MNAQIRRSRPWNMRDAEIHGSTGLSGGAFRLCRQMRPIKASGGVAGLHHRGDLPARDGVDSDPGKGRAGPLPTRSHATLIVLEPDSPEDVPPGNTRGPSRSSTRIAATSERFPYLLGNEVLNIAASILFLAPAEGGGTSATTYAAERYSMKRHSEQPFSKGI